jgi:hypothetical protein
VGAGEREGGRGRGTPPPPPHTHTTATTTRDGPTAARRLLSLRCVLALLGCWCGLTRRHGGRQLSHTHSLTHSTNTAFFLLAADLLVVVTVVDLLVVVAVVDLLMAVTLYKISASRATPWASWCPPGASRSSGWAGAAPPVPTPFPATPASPCAPLTGNHGGAASFVIPPTRQASRTQGMSCCQAARWRCRTS